MPTINSTLTDSSLFLRLQGEIRKQDCKSFRECLKLDGISRLTIDMDGLDFICAEGLSIILEAWNAMDMRHGKLEVLNVGQKVGEELALVDLDLA